MSSFAGAPQRIKSCQLLANAFLVFLLTSQLYSKTKARPFHSHYGNFEAGLVTCFLLVLLDCCLFLSKGWKLYGQTVCGALWLFSLISVVFVQLTILISLQQPQLQFLFYEFALLFIMGMASEVTIRVLIYHRQHAIKSRSRVEQILRLLQCDRNATPMEETCAICLESIRAHPTVRLQCRPRACHYFHSPCFAQWLKENEECPLCRGTSYLIPIKARSSISKIYPL